MDSGGLIREKLTEYELMVGPLDRAEEEISYARRMLRARVDEDLRVLVPVLGALAETLDISPLDMLLAPDRVSFVQAAVDRSGMELDDIRRNLIEASASAREDLRMLGFGEPI